MTELLTESFCERCGTRYTFESVAAGQGRLAGLKVLGLGLKNFVMADGSTIEESMAAARSEAGRDTTNHQLDAFHKTFSFCMTCRQYTCSNCWNAAEAHCLTCAPLAEAASAPSVDEIDPARLLRYTAGSTALAEPDAPMAGTAADQDGTSDWPEHPHAEVAASELADASGSDEIPGVAQD
ncbi:MAG: hypothetical protein ABI598_06760, partial [Chloroflexota bacterium]